MRFRMGHILRDYDLMEKARDLAIATLAVFAGAGGLGDEIYNGGIQRDLFKTGIILPSVIAIALAIAFDGVLLLAQRALSPWRRVRPV